MKKCLNFIVMKFMLKIVAIILIILAFEFDSTAQQYPPKNNAYGTWGNRVMPDSTLHIPTICGTPSGKASLKDVITNKSAILFDSCGKTFWVYSPTDSAWKNAGGVDTFTVNPTVNGTSFGKYPSGSTPNWKGLTAIQAIEDAIVQVIHPTYTAPSASISSSPGQGSYEIGTNLGTITLSSTYNQNNGGSSTGTTYSKYVSSWNNLGSNTDAISSLTQTTYYRVTISYNAGSCLTNNVGQTDCVGQITSGSTTSSNIQFTPYYKRYWGWSNSTSPGNSAILALTTDNNGSTGSITLSNQTPDGSQNSGNGQYLVYFTKGTISSATVNGIPATSAFTFTTYSVTNAQGYTSTYTYVYSNAPQTSTLSSVIFQ